MKKLFLSSSLIALLGAGCIQPTEDKDTSPAPKQGVGIQGQLGGNQIQSLGFRTLAASDYEIYCITYTNPPITITAPIADDGTFNITVPEDVPGGCFIRHLQSGESVASVVLVDGESGFNSSSSSSLSLTASVNLGSLDLDIEKGIVEVSRVAVESALTPATPTFNVNLLHERTYEMSCISTGNADLDGACEQMLLQGANTVYFRVLTATKEGETVNGLGVWEDEQAFNDCGGIDALGNEKAQIESEGYAFSQITFGPAFTPDPVLCPLRFEDEAVDSKNLRKYYALDKIVRNGDTYTMHVESEHIVEAGCLNVHRTIVNFRSLDSLNMLGSFQTGDWYVESAPGACNGRTSSHADFIVNFTLVQ